MLELQRPDTLVERVVSAIRAEIDSGRLAAESRLPTEQQLAEQLNVSRSVVREAVAQLKADGVLIARRGLGSYISQTPCGTVFRFPGATGASQTSCRCSRCVCGSKPKLPPLRPAAATTRTSPAWPRLCRRCSTGAATWPQPLPPTWPSTGPLPKPARTIISWPSMIFCGQLATARRNAWENSAALPQGGAADANREHQALYQAIADGDRQAAAACAEAHLRASARRLKIDLPDLD